MPTHHSSIHLPTLLEKPQAGMRLQNSTCKDHSWYLNQGLLAVGGEC